MNKDILIFIIPFLIILIPVYFIIKKIDKIHNELFLEAIKMKIEKLKEQEKEK